MPGHREVRGARPPAISWLQPLDERARVTLRGLLRGPQPGPGPSSSLQGRATPARSQGRPHPGLPRRRAPLAPLRQPLAGPYCEASLASSRPPLRASLPSNPAPGALAGGSGCHPPCPSGAPVSARKGRGVHTRDRRKPKALPRSSGALPTPAREEPPPASVRPLRSDSSSLRSARRCCAALGAEPGMALAGPPGTLSPLVPPGGDLGGDSPAPPGHSESEA